ncbi:hypothetical protein PP713_08640 [Mycobacterium sp. CSUR Q5927]|nr:hypothetical protein [Mycobacterium sp. CSUR Q5927]
MAETVTVTPRPGQLDANNDPLPAGEPITLTPLLIAPGNTVLKYGVGGDLDDVQFTVYLPLQVRRGNNLVPIETLVADDDQITVRGRECMARVKVWRSPQRGLGGAVVLARAATGAT